MLNPNKFFLIFVFALMPFISNAQTISSKEFTNINQPVFLIEGLSNFSAASRNQASSSKQKNLLAVDVKNLNQNSQNIGNDTQIFLKSGIMTKSHAKYGAVAKVEFNYNSDSRNENPNLDQAFLFSEGDFGKFEFGNHVAVNQKMKVGAAKIARGAGGINGKYLENINLPMTQNSATNLKMPAFILLAQSPVGHGGYARSFYSSINGSAQNDLRSFNKSNFRALKDDSFDGVEDATKISYYSPRIFDLQLGVSYAPSSVDSGITSTRYYNSDLSRMENIFSFGANYAKDFDNLFLEISATAEKSEVKNSTNFYNNSRHDLFAYDVGISASYFGFTTAASYGSWGKSLQPKSGIYSCDYNSDLNLSSQDCFGNNQKFSAANYYTLGLSYEFGPLAASITNLESSFQKNKYSAISLGLDYKLTKDFMPYFEITKFSFKSNQVASADSNLYQINNNRGYVALTGILFSF